MKKLFVLLFTFVAISCTDDSPLEPNYSGDFERIQGNWTMVYFRNGWAGGKNSAPKKTPDFTFRKDSSYTYLSIDSTPANGKFDLVVHSHDEKRDTTWMLKSLTKDSLWFEYPVFVYFNGNDKLEIIEDAGDGFVIICERIR